MIDPRTARAEPRPATALPGIGVLVRNVDVVGFIREVVVDDFLGGVALPQLQKEAGTNFGRGIEAFSRFSALIGKGLPSPFVVTENTLSAELAKRNNLSIRGAHALLINFLLKDSRGLVGKVAIELLKNEAREATLAELMEMRSLVPARHRKLIDKEINRRKR